MAVPKRNTGRSLILWFQWIGSALEKAQRRKPNKNVPLFGPAAFWEPILEKSSFDMILLAGLPVNAQQVATHE